jgi:hypothetical protein
LKQTAYCKPARASAPSAIELMPILRRGLDVPVDLRFVPANRQRLGRDAFYLNRGAVREDFGDALHHFGGVITHADHGVRAVLAGMLHH